MITKIFCIVTGDQVDQAVVSLTSFKQFNKDLPVTIICDKYGDFTPLHKVLEQYIDITFIEKDFETYQEFNSLDSSYISSQAFSAIALRIKCIEELLETSDIVINFDIDTLFKGSIQPAIDSSGVNSIYLCTEDQSYYTWLNATEKAQYAWLKNLKPYYNIGFGIYGKNAIQGTNFFSNLLQFLTTTATKCFEQDYVNTQYKDVIIPLSKEYNTLLSEAKNIQQPVMLHFYSWMKPWQHSLQEEFKPWVYEYYNYAKRYAKYLDSVFLAQLKNSVLEYA